MPTRKLPTYYNKHTSILKSKNLPQNLQENIFKYLSYREAWARIKQAHEEYLVKLQKQQLLNSVSIIKGLIMFLIVKR